MPVSSTVSVPFGRAFTSNNPGGRWSATAPGVTLDSEFAASGTISLLATVIRQTTWWIQFTGDLELLPNIEGARNDLVVTVTHPSAGTIVGDISSYQTAASRDGTVSQATITARDTAAQATWGTAVSDDTDALSIVLSSATSGPAAPPPAPAVTPGIVLGGKNVTTVYVGDTEVERVYVGDVRILGDAPPPATTPVIDVTVRTTNDDFEAIWSDGTTMWVLVARSGFGDYMLGYDLSTGDPDTSKDVTLPNTINSPDGLWGDDTFFWISDRTDDMVYAVNRQTAAIDTSRSFSVVNGPEDIWSDGTTLWVETATMSRAYTLADGTRDSSKDIGLSGVMFWSDGTTVWAGSHATGSDPQRIQLLAYVVSTKARDSSKDINVAVIGDQVILEGLWGDGTTLWVLTSDIGTSPETGSIRPYRLSDGTPLFNTG